MSPRHRPDLVVAGRRSTAVWGTVAGAGVLVLLLAYFLYAHLYLAVTADEWPPPESPELPLLQPFALVALVALVAAAALRAGRPVPRGADRLPQAGLLAAGAVVGALAVVLGAGMLGGLDLAGADVAHDASLLVLHGFGGVTALAGVAINVLTAYEAARLGDHPWVGAATAVASIWWTTVAVVWFAIAAVAYGWPQLT